MAFQKQSINTDTIYFNARLNADGLPASKSIPATFSVTMSNPLIQRPEDWDMAIINFNLSLYGMPALFVAHPPQPDPRSTGATNYTFGLRYKGVLVQRNVVWYPADSTIFQTNGGYTDPYWYEYSYIRFGVFINMALSKLAADLSEQGMTIAPPFVSYDQINAVWTLFLPNECLDSNIDPVNFLWSADADQIIAGLPNAPSGIVGLEHQLIAFQQPDEQDVIVGGANYFTRTQLPGSLTTWNPIRRFVFVTSSLGITPEILSQKSANTTISPVTNGKIITDLTPVLSRGDELINGTLIYNPSAQYRIINLIGTSPLTQIDFSICAEWADGSLSVVDLKNGGHASVKFAFMHQ